MSIIRNPRFVSFQRPGSLFLILGLLCSLCACGAPETPVTPEEQSASAVTAFQSDSSDPLPTSPVSETQVLESAGEEDPIPLPSGDYYVISCSAGKETYALDGAYRLPGETGAARRGIPCADRARLMRAMSETLAEFGADLTDGLTAGQNATLARYLDGELLETFARFEPWVTTYSLANAIYVNSGLAAEMGLDTVLLAAAQEEGRTVEGLDDLQVQLDGITYGSYDEQLAMLQDLLDDLRDPSAALAEVKSLYDAYLADDRQAVDLLNTGSMDEDRARHPFYEGYYRLLISERNRDWAKDITAYLREGGTTFIFAGAAHWVGDDSVFSYLRTMGTIE